MSTKTDQATAELTATIFPAIVAMVKGNDRVRALPSPLGRKEFSIFERHEDRITAETPHPYILEIDCHDTGFISIPARTQEDACMQIAAEVASDLMKAEELLANARAALGVTKPA